MTVLEEMGNQFLEHSQDLLVIDTKDIMDTQVAEAASKIDILGEEQYTKFAMDVTERLEQSLFSRPPVRIKSKQKAQLAALKNDCSLFRELTFPVKHEMETSTVSLLMKSRQPHQLCHLEEKCVLELKQIYILRCLESYLHENDSVPVMDATILDGAAVVQMLNPGTSRTLQEYGERVFAPYICAQLEKSSRIDLVWDVYLPTSLKASTRQKRGKAS